MVFKVNYVCQKCGQAFTRRASGKRHNNNQHSNMAMIIESVDYFAGITNGKYKPPDGPPSSFRKKNSFRSNFMDIKISNENSIPLFNKQRNHESTNNNDYNLNSKQNLLFNHFIVNNAAFIDFIIEEYEQKLLPFLNKEEINTFIKKWIIIPLSTIIETKEDFYNYINRIDNLVGYVRILKRGGVNDINTIL
jgi:hypothetical protein